MTPKLCWPLSLVFLALAASIAAADSDVRTGELRDRRDRSALSVNIGLFTPTGGVGVEYVHALHPNVELGVGAGLGYIAIAAIDRANGIDSGYRVRPEFSLMPRVRMRREMLRVALGAGLSSGTYQSGPFGFNDGDWFDYAAFALFANGEGVAQVIFRNGWFGGARLGATFVVAHSKVHTSGDPTHMADDPRGAVLPYVGVSFGRTL